MAFHKMFAHDNKWNTRGVEAFKLVYWAGKDGWQINERTR